jgi:hypothetical protein
MSRPRLDVQESDQEACSDERRELLERPLSRMSSKMRSVHFSGAEPLMYAPDPRFIFAWSTNTKFTHLAVRSPP